METVSQEFDLPPPPRRSHPKDIEVPVGTTLDLYASVGTGMVVIRNKKRLRVRSARRSQIVLAGVKESSVTSCPVETQVVAKFFDPLFVSGFGNEVAAYSSLCPLQGSVVPIFYGEYACHFADRSIEADQTVKVILMEHIDGWPLSWYQHGELTESQEQWIERQAYAIMGQVHSHGVIHGDLAVRNFLLTKTGRMVLVDFEESEIKRAERVFARGSQRGRQYRFELPVGGL
ncbi:hypothetical protein POJ06DRAFT_270271 [Lipomyces tetrasporus]|uniref:non-specific serine/threonine protein kinase n=1 Tax=Lipomyces tetrasporus TaxID=54092 RepID=A0AAD7QR80_9ASCO|nr:uncharacterized protein POJ06DRAFT_270271 [Lipomyces tetrasporus]KAJ8098297.1 hypothetical protein POJ06DRAFT_270271 [Lipomyces tetrasporus]